MCYSCSQQIDFDISRGAKGKPKAETISMGPVEPDAVNTDVGN
ncbi:hypothetical protein MACH09_21500 [Vibrio sp. MACH09]|nr:hypothetical protein MACH09_21500 [Vibrio sp. MACH09]